MSLVAFKAQNHRQQIGKRGAKPAVDDRATAPEVFAPLHARFGFTVDVAALPHNAKLERYYTPDDDGLAQSWAGERVWCNPPYSSIEPWLVKAWASEAELVVMLLPANRTEQGWWQRHIEPRRDVPGGVRVEFLSGRMRFIRADAERIGPNERPPFGVCLVIWDRTPPSPYISGGFAK
jgi:phage N-6-adenine-methyltransferase